MFSSVGRKIGKKCTFARNMFNSRICSEIETNAEVKDGMGNQI